MNKKIKLFEAFAGIGSQHRALNNISKKKHWDIEVVGIIEWFIPAISAYIEIHGNNNIDNINLNQLKEIKTKLKETNLSLDSKRPISINNKNKIIDKWFEYLAASMYKYNNTFDITQTSYLDIAKNIDIFTYSFPCQDLSNQGKQKGMNKNSGTRSGLLWEVERIITEMHLNWKNNEKPKYLLLENVSEIGNKKNLSNLNQWINKLEELGYETKIYYLNASNFGSPQNRKRAYGLSVLKSWKKKTNFQFSNLENIDLKNKKTIKHILSKNIKDESLWMPELNKYQRSSFIKTKSNLCKSKLVDYSSFSSESYIYDPNYTGPTLTASGAHSRIKILDNNKIRRLSAEESLKYMGFKSSDYKKIKKINLSEQKIIYLAGNSIVINVLEKIFDSLIL